MKQIELTQGQFAIVDDEDFERLNQWLWQYDADARKATHHLWNPNRTLFLHREVMKAKKGEWVTPINGDWLDCRKSNLTLSRSKHEKRHGYIGVNRIVDRYKCKDGTIKEYVSWQAIAHHEGKNIRLGRGETPEEAALIYDREVRKLKGDKAVLNFPDITEYPDPKPRIKPGKTSKYIGVSLSQNLKHPWNAFIDVDGKRYHIGYFATEIEAAKARDAIAVACFGSEAKLNFPGEPVAFPGRNKENHSSQYTGVTRYDYWAAAMSVNGKTKVIGRFKTELEAALAYDREARKLGRPTNFPDVRECRQSPEDNDRIAAC